MKFLCPNCKAKYRIGPEKMVGRQAAKIRCRKCEYLIQIAYRPNSDEFDVTASPPSVAPPPPSVPPPPRAPKGGAAGPVTGGNAGSRARMGGLSKDEGSANKKPTTAVPGLPGLGSPKSRNGAALLSDASALGRRPLAPLPPPPVPPLGIGAAPPAPNAPPASFGGGLDGVSSAVSSNVTAGPSLGQAAPRAPASTQLADQFRESVQAGGAVEDLPQEGWFVGVNGVPLGPIPLGDLRELALAGHIDRRSLVWRDGQAEWRPLGKFPGLARVIDDGASGSAQRNEPSPVPAPAASRSNGANGHSAGHVATGFDVPRADAGERPSVWGDLDDEDDEDEQPTTVKGRVSVMPIGGVAPSVTGLPLPSSPSAAPPSASNPFGVTSALVAPPPQPGGSAPPAAFSSPPAAFSSPPAYSSPPAVSEPAAPVSIISASPEPMDEPDDNLRSPGRSKWYLIAVAIVFAFALGAIVTHLMRSSGKASSEASSPSSASALSKRPYEDGSTDERAAGDRATSDRAAADGAGAESAAGAARKGNGREAGTTSITAALRPSDAEDRAELAAAKASLAASSAGWNGARSAPKPRATGPVLAALGGAGMTGSGLDATAIQRTVRRHSPGVRQNCWLRALDARPRGVPTSAKLTATITVEANGQVQGVAVSGAPRGYPSLSRCVENAVKSWQFPRSSARTITNVPFMFMGQ